MNDVEKLAAHVIAKSASAPADKVLREELKLSRLPRVETAAVADLGWIKFSGFIAWLLWCVVHIFFLIGIRNRFRVMSEWVWYYLTFKPGARLIYGRLRERVADKPAEQTSDEKKDTKD